MTAHPYSVLQLQSAGENTHRKRVDRDIAYVLWLFADTDLRYTDKRNASYIELENFHLSPASGVSKSNMAVTESFQLQHHLAATGIYGAIQEKCKPIYESFIYPSLNLSQIDNIEYLGAMVGEIGPSKKRELR